MGVSRVEDKDVTLNVGDVVLSAGINGFYVSKKVRKTETIGACGLLSSGVSRIVRTPSYNIIISFVIRGKPHCTNPFVKILLEWLYGLRNANFCVL
jgi:hypothetical protein